jgi:SAM-dependent methyltransferase
MKRLAFTALAALPHPWRLSIICSGLRVARRAESGDLFCNVCETPLARFKGALSADELRRAYGVTSNPLDLVRGQQRAFCPVCGEAERERLLFCLLRDSPIDGKRVLATSPGVFSQRALRRRCNYVSSNYNASPLYAVDADLCKLQFAAESFDIVISFHVLEHIPDDRQALREIHRVLAPNGTLLLCLPQHLDTARTDNNDPKDPEERMRRFGHPDHRRLYGADVPELLREHGFDVRTFSAEDVPEEERRRLALLKTDRIHVAMKAAAASR